MQRFNERLHWITFFIILCTVKSIHAKDKLVKRQSSACRTGYWRCNNGECINDYELCDGVYNCADQSDETSSSCYNIPCPYFAFRCTYGGCVNGDAECNGVQDCVDNSDELSLKCPGVLETFSLKGNCSEHEFQCDNGECIKEFNLCDGIADCSDRSDETIKRCTNTFCPSYGFRCGYGACVSGTAKCDGNRDCIDGSDENYRLCGYTSVTTSEAPFTTASCTLTGIPINGKATYDGQPNIVLKNNDIIGEYTTINFICNSKYLLIGEKINFCFGGKWTKPFPKCTRTCSFLPLSGVSIKTDCMHRGIPISCDQALLPGTIARIGCNFGYRKPQTQLQETLRCGADGEWDYTPFRCEQICGVVQSEYGVQYIVGGERKNNTNVPWHVGIYSNLVVKNSYSQICGGTILNARVIITAAHCFWDASEGTFHDKKHFQVVTGKYYRDYYAEEPLKIGIFNIEDLKTIRGYNDETDKFNNDVALLVLDKYISFKSYIVPICFDQNLSHNEHYIPSGWKGIVAGWGLIQTAGISSTELKVIELPTVDYFKCINDSTPEFKPFITADKFCAGFINSDLSVCQGDSGGGLVFPRSNDLDGTQFYLRGLVSTGANKHGSCDADKYATFTNIQFHINFIIETESEYRPK